MENFLDAAAVEIWAFQDRRDLAKIFTWTVGKCFRMRPGPVGHEGSCETSAGPGPPSHPRLADTPPPSPLLPPGLKLSLFVSRLHCLCSVSHVHHYTVEHPGSGPPAAAAVFSQGSGCDAITVCTNKAVCTSALI